MAGVRWNDDGELLELLDDALREAREVPPEFVAAGQAVFTWRNIDAELAALVYDSASEPVTTRADTASLRALTYATGAVTIEVEITADGLQGQVIPSCEANVEILVHGHVTGTVAADHLGMFTLREPPSQAFRLRCRFGTEFDVMTPLISP